MTFLPNTPVLWNGEVCTVAMVRGDSIALTRDRDGFTIITTADALAGHQAPVATQPPSRSLIGAP